jgi:hypothetical protein
MILSIEELRRRVAPVAEKYKLKAVYVFGSYARGEAREDSDVDLLIDDTDSGLRGLAYGGLCYDLEEALEKEISFVTIDSLEQPARHKSDIYFRENVSRERREIYVVA